MSILVTRAGLQSTVQARPRTGQRHLGVPLCGPADPLSMALANRLLGNALLAPALEITLSGIEVVFEVDCAFAICGASCEIVLNGKAAAAHTVYRAKAGNQLRIGPAAQGVRSYLAVAGGLLGDDFLGSVSTYLPAELGGFQGRALRDQDRIALACPQSTVSDLQTPAKFRLTPCRAWALRACPGAEFSGLSRSDQDAVFDSNFVVGRRGDRMGVQLQGKSFRVASAGQLDSQPIFPGCLQCPENGVPYLLGVDAQTTGGYSQLAQVARVDRHVIGQLRAGDQLRLLPRTPQQAAAELQEKHSYWREWLADIESVI
jgi:biotin-dependent carboxylase-like uncharacterized protein